MCEELVALWVWIGNLKVSDFVVRRHSFGAIIVKRGLVVVQFIGDLFFAEID